MARTIIYQFEGVQSNIFFIYENGLHKSYLRVFCEKLSRKSQELFEKTSVYFFIKFKVAYVKYFSQSEFFYFG